MSVAVMTWVMHHAPRELRGSELVVALALAEHATPEGGHAFPSVRRLATICRMSERSVQRALRNLIDLGVIEVEEEATRRTPTVYAFVHFRGDKCDGNGKSGVTNPTFRGDKSGKSGVTNPTFRGDNGVTLTVREPSTTEPSEEPERGDPSPKVSKRKKIATELPADWDTSIEFGPLYDWARDELGMTEKQVDFETDKFMDHWRGNGELKVDWLATWRNWMRRSQERFRGRGR